MEVAALHSKRTDFVAPLALLAGLWLALVNFDADAGNSSASESAYFIEGYDVVSYFRDSGPQPGKTSITTTYQDNILLFSTEANRSDFLANPEIFMPAYNGYCAYGMVFGMKSKVDPLQYDIVDGRLFLQLDKGTKRRWNRRISRNIRKSEKAWKKLSASVDD